jgi:hypothetical protein
MFGFEIVWTWNIYIWKMFEFEKCSDTTNIQIWEMFILEKNSILKTICI